MEENHVPIPEGWKSYVGNEILNVQGGYAFKSDDYKDEGVLLVRIGNIGNGNFIFKDVIYIPNRFQLTHSNFQLWKGDVLMGLTGDLGKICILRNGNFPYFLNQRVGRFILTDKIDNEYLFYLISSSFIQSKFDAFFAGGAQKNISPKQIESINYLIPESKVEQRLIASILSKLDEAITQTEKLIDKYKKIKEGLMHDLLTRGIDEQGNIRSEDTHKFKDSPLGRIPEEWECCEIGNACYVTKLSGFEFTKYMEYRDDGEIIAIRAMNIKNEQLILDDVQRISKKVSEFLVRSKLHSGDILITYIGAYIGDILQIKEDNKYHLAPNVAKIVGGPKLTPDFLEFMMRSTKVQRFIKSLVTTTANPSLTMGQIRTVYIIYPKDKKEQDRISKRLSTLNILINKTSSELEKLFLQKSGLMHDLLTGKVRVKI